MNRKGFTLAELLGVLVLLSTLAALAISTIDKNIKDGRYKTCISQERIIIEGAKAYLIDNPNAERVTISELKNGGYIDAKLENPMTENEYNNNTNVTIDLNKKYTINYVGEKECK